MFRQQFNLRSSALRLGFYLASTVLTVANASEPDIERAQLTLLLRQLDALELQAEHSAALPQQRPTRYHFDYPRLRDDLQRVRSGVQDYLTPQRAQPRDPVPMLGDYRNEQEPSP
jgi:RAQPRD family integrative conjugative element protein